VIEGLMSLYGIVSNLRFQDGLDILFLTVVVYYLTLWFWGTKAFKALVGLLALGLIYTATRSWGLFLTTWVFEILWQVLVILIIILFQTEIRQVLERVNPLQMLGLRTHERAADWVPGLIQALMALSRKKIGALIIIERLDWVEEWLTGGVVLEGEPGTELIMSLFQKESLLHDGAMLIRKGKITRVSCYLPLSSAENLPTQWGTRHRAALGLSEKCDARILVVSEERGEISLARNGEMVHLENLDHLSRAVNEAIQRPQVEGGSWSRKARQTLTHRWKLKLGILALVSFFWLLLAGQQNFEATLVIPVETRNLPSNLEIESPLDPAVRITVRGLRKDASTLDRRNVNVELDLSSARIGTRIYRLSRDQIALPNDRVNIVDINPSQLEFKFKQRP
jgi:diadenylate cyclase